MANEPCVEPKFKNKFSVRLANTTQPSQALSRETSQPKYYVLPPSKPVERQVILKPGEKLKFPKTSQVSHTSTTQ